MMTKRLVLDVVPRRNGRGVSNAALFPGSEGKSFSAWGPPAGDARCPLRSCPDRRRSNRSGTLVDDPTPSDHKLKRIFAVLCDRSEPRINVIQRVLERFRL